MFNRIRFEIKPKAVQISIDPFFTNDYVVYHEVRGEIRVLERNLAGFEVKDDNIRIYDVVKTLRYDIDKENDYYKITVEEMSLETLLNLGLSREALDQIILLKKRVINP